MTNVTVFYYLIHGAIIAICNEVNEFDSELRQSMREILGILKDNVKF